MSPTDPPNLHLVDRSHCELRFPGCAGFADTWSSASKQYQCNPCASALDEERIAEAEKAAADLPPAEKPTPAPVRTVREFSPAGPCLQYGPLIRETARFYIYRDTWHGRPEGRVMKRTEAHYSRFHLEPCPRCTDHPRTTYPNGYMD